MDASVFNGADRDTYRWSQNHSELDIQVVVPKSIVSGRDVRIDIKTDYIDVEFCDDGNWRKAVKGQLSWPVRAHDTIWTLLPGQHIHIHLEKERTRWWDSLLVGEPAVTAMERITALEDLPSEEQMKVHELLCKDQEKIRRQAEQIT